MTAEAWVLASDEELPDRFADPRCDDFLYVCSNGWIGSISIGSALIHKPRAWPQCFPDGEDGEDGDAACTCVLIKRENSTGAPT